LQIHIHVGVHKTATTFIQSRLKGNLAKLNRAGIGYMPIWAFRTSFWKELMKIDPAGFRIEDHLGDFFPRGAPKEVRGIIISDENLLGLCGPMLRTGKLYGGARPRMAHLRKLLAGHEVTLFCAVRRYDAFLASAYCEGLRTNKRYITFEDFTNRVNWKTISWLPVLNKIETGLQPDRVRYWRYEQFRPRAEEVLQELAFGHQLDETEMDPGKTAYASFSQTAVDALDSVSERLGRTVASTLVRPISAALPKSEGYADFDPWGPVEKRRLARRYFDDCQTIAPEKWFLPLEEEQGDQVQADEVLPEEEPPGEARGDEARPDAARPGQGWRAAARRGGGRPGRKRPDVKGKLRNG